MTISKRRIKELRNVQNRQFLYEEHIESGLPIQIRELRKKRGLTQKELSALTGCDQSNISNWENPNYEYTPNISTLKILANAFDVPLIVRFGTWKELLNWDDSITSDLIAPDNFEDEFQEDQKRHRTQDEIREFIGDDPAQAVERVRKCGNVRSRWLTPVCGCWYAEVSQFEQAFVKQYGLAAYGAGLAPVMGLSHNDVYGRAADYFGSGDDRGVIAS